MDYIEDLYNKANRIMCWIALVFVAILILDTLVIRLIPLSYLRITAIILIVLYVIGYISNLWFQHYENYVCMSDSPKDYLWSFRNLLDDYHGKTYRDYSGNCNNGDRFEDEMEEFSELFDDRHQDNFGKTLWHDKEMHHCADNYATKKKAKHEADKFLNKKYAQLVKFVRHHNHQKLWTTAENNGFKHLPKVCFKEDEAMNKLMDS